MLRQTCERVHDEGFFAYNVLIHLALHVVELHLSGLHREKRTTNISGGVLQLVAISEADLVHLLRQDPGCGKAHDVWRI